MVNEALLLGNPFTAEQAQSLGLVNYALAAEEVVETARQQAITLAKKSPRALQEAKRLIRSADKQTGLEVMKDELEVFFSHLDSTDFREAISAMKEKREPQFN